MFVSDVYKMEQEQAVDEQRNRARLTRMASAEAPPKVAFSIIVSFFSYIRCSKQKTAALIPCSLFRLICWLSYKQYFEIYHGSCKNNFYGMCRTAVDTCMLSSEIRQM